jgi:hypothetical protein
VNRRLKQLGPTRAHATLLDQRRQILGSLALSHLLDPEQPANSLRWSEAVRKAKSILRCGDAEAEAAFRELAKDTGLVTEERPGETYRFLHLTFCEFLAAFEAAQGLKNGWETLIAAHRGFMGSGEPQLCGRLLEALPFAAALLPRFRYADALSDLEGLSDRRLLARGFLETKLYDHLSWRTFHRASSEFFLTSPESSRDEQWLRELHLFTVVARDANLCAAHLPNEGFDVDGFFRTLGEQAKDNLSQLLSAYAAQDAAAAFRLADALHVELAERYPGLVIESCDQKPFLALALQRAVRATDKPELWASLLAEAGLRSPVVANWLGDETPFAAWSALVDEVPHQLHWMEASLATSTLFTQCLTIAVGPRGRRGDPWRLIGVLTEAPSPASMRWQLRLMNVFMWAIVPFFALVYIATARVLGLGTEGSGAALLFIVSALLAYATLALAASSAVRIRGAYTELLGRSSGSLFVQVVRALNVVVLPTRVRTDGKGLTIEVDYFNLDKLPWLGGRRLMAAVDKIVVSRKSGSL